MFTRKTGRSFFKIFGLPAKTDSEGGRGTAVLERRRRHHVDASSGLFLREQDGHRLFYGSVSDISQQKRKEKRL